ncbi:MAG: hypothetical protein B7Y08_29610 [Rhodospirillales bacterium 24-66-33]|nr:MAG: hypothetical protein B7Y57_11450 [Rhodospirillales bacterium 35-66-84]OYZ90527.1 MAG: hypothetical protein B7Y08_29610 [Rhodospirillales bacterium 24-66-33]OZB25215.1 MAG: hypothetical protein B7X63_12125 [Rhodospirillales bacterium 39-66-50]
MILSIDLGDIYKSIDHSAATHSVCQRRSKNASGAFLRPGSFLRLIRDMSLANPLWGAARIHGELLKLGIEVAQSTVAKYMA